MDEATSADLTEPLSDDVPRWLRALSDDARAGLDVLGPDHAATYLDGGDTLLVTFGQFVPALGDPAPFGEGIGAAQGWSRLHLLARRPDWFRAPVIADYLRACPGAHVVAIAPQATLDPEIAGWDNRWPVARRLEFKGRFGFAPAGCDLAETATVIYDPAQPLDAMHATLFRRPTVRLLRTPALGGPTAARLAGMGALDAVLRAAVEGQLDTQTFARICRARKSDPAWLTGLAERALAKGQAARALIVVEQLAEAGAGLRARAVDILRASLP